jgi:hypothetical protein
MARPAWAGRVPHVRDPARSQPVAHEQNKTEPLALIKTLACSHEHTRQPAGSNPTSLVKLILIYLLIPELIP